MARFELHSNVRLAVLIGVALVVSAILWLVASRSVSMMMDRVHVTRLTEATVNEIRYDSGTIEVAGSRLDTLTTETLPSGLQLAVRPSGRALLKYEGKLFPCGTGKLLSTYPSPIDVAISADLGDSVRFVTERSHLSWPTPFEMNFMTGYAPTWRRHSYCRLTWVKSSGARMEIVWRVRQGLFNQDGWRPAVVKDVSAGVLRITVTEAVDLQDSAAEYLTRNRHWQRSSYQLENRGPSTDRRSEMIAAIHHDDEQSTRPGSGLSVLLLVDYASRKVSGEAAFQ